MNKNIFLKWTIFGIFVDSEQSFQLIYVKYIPSLELLKFFIYFFFMKKQWIGDFNTITNVLTSLCVICFWEMKRKLNNSFNQKTRTFLIVT